MDIILKYFLPIFFFILPFNFNYLKFFQVSILIEKVFILLKMQPKLLSQKFKLLM